MRLELAAAIRKATSPAEARSAIAKVKARAAKSNEIADAIFRPRVLADLAGQLMVHEHEAPGVVIEPMTASFTAADGQPLDAFLNLPWDEAVEYFRGRGLMDEDELSTLLKGHAETTKQVRRDMLDNVQKRVNEMLAQAIEQGQSYEEFAAQIAASADGLGITNQDPHYIDTVFRTGTMDAYGAGRHKAMQDPAVVEARPFRQIQTAGDGRVSEAHRPLDGLVYRADGPLQNLRTPFNYKCRCVIISLGRDYNGPVVDSLPPGSVAPGFGGL
jgi:SPP1 gp7 family putative phage head morphogenesis protein